MSRLSYRPAIFLRDLLVFVIGVAACAWLLSQAMPHIEGKSYAIDEGELMSLEFPLNIQSTGKNVRAEVTLRQPFLYRPLVEIWVDDCLEDITVDGVTPDGLELPFCGGSLKGLNITNAIPSGTHQLVLRVRDDGGLLRINVRHTLVDPLLLSLLAIITLLCGWFAYRLLGLWGTDRRSWWLLVPIVVGLLLRIGYMVATPHDVRSHEWDRHMEYVDHVAQNGTIPPAAGGWEYHQPPLYYYLAAGWMRGFSLIHIERAQILADLQLLSLLFSLAAFGLGIWIGYLLFPDDKHDRKQAFARTIFIGILATLPSLIYTASRISNDALYQPLSFLFVALLLLWMKNGNIRVWYALALVIALSLLVKFSAIAFIPIALIALYAHGRSDRNTKTVMTGGMLGLIGVLWAWLPILRLMEPDTTRTLVLGNEGMSPLTNIPTSPGLLLTFNPLRVFDLLYNNPVSIDARKEFFWEYFFRSIFFGEFPFPASFERISTLLLLFGMLMIPLLLYGFVIATTKRTRNWLPMIATFLLLLVAAVAYRVQFPHSPNQDFRFSTLLTIPAAWMCVTGAFALRHPIIKRTALSVLAAFPVLCGIFIMKIILSGTA
jgi:hypothetical protein